MNKQVVCHLYNGLLCILLEECEELGLREGFNQEHVQRTPTRRLPPMSTLILNDLSCHVLKDQRKPSQHIVKQRK